MDLGIKVKVKIYLQVWGDGQICNSHKDGQDIITDR